MFTDYSKKIINQDRTILADYTRFIDRALDGASNLDDLIRLYRKGKKTVDRYKKMKEKEYDRADYYRKLRTETIEEIEKEFYLVSEDRFNILIQDGFINEQGERL